MSFGTVSFGTLPLGTDAVGVLSTLITPAVGALTLVGVAPSIPVVLSAATVINILATTATPQVVVTF